jgi:DNA-binding CsgD family transcriptional regulator
MDLLRRKIDFWLVDRLAMPASVHDRDGIFLHLNPAGEWASGYTAASVRGRHFAELLPPGSREQVLAHFEAATQGSAADFETVFFDAHHKLMGARAQYLPLLDGVEVVGVLILAFDVRLHTVELPAPALPPKLTRRQREILTLVAGGMSTPQIAEHLTLSSETVSNHLRSVYSLLRAHSRLEAVVAAQRLGLLPPQPLGRGPAGERPLH